MANALQDFLNQQLSSGLYDPPSIEDSSASLVPVQTNTGAANIAQPSSTQTLAQQTLAQVIANAAPASSSGGGSNSNPTSGSYDPQSLTQSQRQSLWEANGHSGTAPDGYGGEGGGTSQADQAAALQQSITDAYNTANTQYQQGVSAYDKANPFVMSDMLAKEATNASNSVSPYYDQLLTNYLQGVAYQRGNTIQDEARLATKLQADSDAFQGQAAKTLATTMQQAGQQYSDAGSYDSGARARTQGISAANTDYDVSNNQRQTAYDIGSAELQENREINQTLPLQTTEYEQEQDRNEATDIATTQAQNYNYDLAQNRYNEAEAGLANITANGNLQAAGAFPGMSSAQTSQQLASLLPNVTGNLSTPLYQNYNS